MILKNLDNIDLDNFPVAIFGSGPAGITTALELEKKNIKTIATQERFIHTFYISFSNVIVDTYYVASEFAANYIKKSKFY